MENYKTIQVKGLLLTGVERFTIPCLAAIGAVSVIRYTCKLINHTQEKKKKRENSEFI